MLHDVLMDVSGAAGLQHGRQRLGRALLLRAALQQGGQELTEDLRP